MPSYTSYLRQMAVLDADDNEIESWITVRGNHIPIKKGQSKEDAVKSFIAGKKKNLVENHNSLVEAMNLEEKGYFKKDPKKRDSITQSAIEMGKEEKNLEELMEFGVKEGNAAKPESKKDYTIAHKDKSGNTTIIAEVSHHDIGEKEDKAYNDKGLYQDALNELDDQIADKEKELENIQLSITQNAESGYFDIANETLQDAEFVKGQLEELKKKREKLAGSSGTKAPKVTKVDAKKWNSPASDPWKSLYD